MNKLIAMIPTDNTRLTTGSLTSDFQGKGKNGRSVELLSELNPIMEIRNRNPTGESRKPHQLLNNKKKAYYINLYINRIGKKS